MARVRRGGFTPRNMFIVYVLKNTQGKLYIGQTVDIVKRLHYHNELGRGYTSIYRPWKLLYSEKLDSRKEAMAREKYLKTGVGREWIEKNIKRD